LPGDADKKLRLIENVPFQNTEQLLARVKQLVGEDTFIKISNSVPRLAARTPGELQFEPFDLGYYALFTFGSLLFIIAGAYLPQLTSLKFAGLQLDKSTAERVEILRTIGIPR
jgi:hypothetical protein